MKLRRQVLACGTLAVLICGIVPSSAQEEEEEQKIDCAKVPAVVRSTFEKSYPNATIEGCAEEAEDGETVYEIASDEGETHRDVIYYPDGKLVLVEESIPTSAVPEPVLKAIQKKLPKGEITLAEKVMRGSSITYEFQVRSGEETSEIVFDPSGKELEQ
jgi:Putative beta-lactamase-inhibitor-like, PepSY-like